MNIENNIVFEEKNIIFVNKDIIFVKEKYLRKLSIDLLI